MRIRQGNDFIFLWAIERSGEPEDFSNAVNIRLHFKNFDCIGEVKSFQIVDGNIVRVEVSPEWASNLGAYRLILSYEFEDSSYSDGDQKCVVDVLAFNIVPKTSEADDVTEMAKTTDILIGLKGDKGDPFIYDDFTPEQIEDLKRPAVEAVESVLIVENQISINEQGRVQAENERETAETTRVSNENNRGTAEQERLNAESLRVTAESSRELAESLRVEAELLRQSNTQEAISNAENATENANTAAQNADDARLAIQDDLALKANHGYESNPKTLKEVDDFTQIGIKNLVRNGDFSGGDAYWTSWSSINEVENGKLINTGIAATSAIELSAISNIGEKIIGHKYYFHAEVTVKSALCNRLRFYSAQDIANPIHSPIENNLYVVSGVTIANNTGSTLFINHRYVSKEDSIGSSIEIDNVLFVDLTEAFGEGNEPTKEEMDAFYEYFGYWEGDTLSRNNIFNWLLDKINTNKTNIELKFNTNKTNIELKANQSEINQIAEDLAEIAGSSLIPKASVFEASSNLQAGVATIIPYSEFEPALTERPVGIQVFKDCEQKNVTVKYLTNGENFDISLISDATLDNVHVSVLGTKSRYKVNVGDIALWDSESESVAYHSPITFELASLPSELTVVGVVFHIENGEAYILSKDDQAENAPWAVGFKAKVLGFDFSTGGSFTISVNSVTTQLITYTPSDNLTTISSLILAKLNTNVGAASTALDNWTVEVDLVNDCIIMKWNFYNPTINTFAITDTSNKVEAVIICADKITTASGVTPYPNLLLNNGTYYGSAGLNWERFSSYLYTGGDDRYGQTPTSNLAINFARFNQTDNPLLVEYYGSGEDGYEKYLKSLFIKYPFPSTEEGFKNGKDNTSMLSSETFIDIDNLTKHYYPAAHFANSYGISVVGQTTGFESGNWWLPTVYEMFFMFNARKTDKSDLVNVGITKIGGTNLNNGNIAFWTCSEQNGSNAFANYGSSGRYSAFHKRWSINGNIPLHVRAITRVKLN